MPDSKLTFDADTAAYNAHIDESHRKNLSLVSSFKDMAEPLLKVVSIAGALELGIEAVKSRWEQWREQIRGAEEESKRVGSALAAVVGAAGLLAQYPQIKKAVQESQGPLSTEQKTQAIAGITGAFPGLSAEQVILGLAQSQKAAQVVGPENLGTFATALGLAMESGLKQDRAGDVAIAVAQSGSHGLEAFQRAAAQFAQDYSTPEARSSGDFLKYIQNAGPDVFGNRPTQQLGGQAVQSRLRGNVAGQLDRDAAAAPQVDEELSSQRARAARDAASAAAQQKNYGKRAELETEVTSLQAALRARGEAAFSGPLGLRSDQGLLEIIEGLKANLRNLGVHSDGVTRFGAAEEFANLKAREAFPSARADNPLLKAEHDRVLKVLEGIHSNTAEPKGAPKFRNDAQDLDK